MATSLIRPIAVNVNTGAITYEGGITTSEITDGTIAAADLAAPLGWGILVSGSYYFATAQQSTTAAALSQGSLRVGPWYLPNSVTISKIGAEVTITGDSGSKFRLGIYADNGSGYPGSLVLDAGQIAGDSATVQEITVSQTLSAGLYWIGGVTQSVSVTAPTYKVGQGIPPVHMLSVGTSTPGAGVAILGYQQASVTGALPGTFTASLTASTTIPKVFVKVA